MPHPYSIRSSVAQRFLSPLREALALAHNLFDCHVLPDEQWLELGVRRCLGLCQSGRDFLQHFADVRAKSIGLSTFFESLKSLRRHALSREMNTALLGQLKETMPDPFQVIDPTGALEEFDLYAGDGHFHSAACHDPTVPRKPSTLRSEETCLNPEARLEQRAKYPVGHLYCLNLRTQGLSHLCLLDQINRKKEHDMRALKALSPDSLRQGAPKGRKVLLIWDRAGIDFRQWHRWKHQNAIYFLSREKENMRLEVVGTHSWDRLSPCNAHVLADEEMATSEGVAIRRVQFQDIERGRTFAFLTNLPKSVPPGLVALLYRNRWNVEKVFDEVKNKLGETKAWATSPAAKRNHAGLICLTHNLLTLFEARIAKSEGIVNEPELHRKTRMLALATLKGAACPSQHAQRSLLQITVRTVKFIRWVRNHLDSTASWQRALAHLSRVYASL